MNNSLENPGPNLDDQAIDNQTTSLGDLLRQSTERYDELYKNTGLKTTDEDVELLNTINKALESNKASIDIASQLSVVRDSLQFIIDNDNLKKDNMDK